MKDFSIENQFKALFEINQAINDFEDEQDIFTRILDVVLKTIHARRGFIVSYDKATEQFLLQTARNIAEQDISDIKQASGSILWEAIQSGKVVFSYDAQHDERFEQAQSIKMHNIRSVVAVPIRIRKETTGVIFVDSPVGKDEFVERSLDFLNFFANQAAILLENAQLYKKLQSENILLKKEIIQYRQFEELVGSSPAIKKTYKIIDKVSRSDASVLLLGESGTGKELAARAIHNRSRRSAHPFVAQYCGALTETLLESELFGHVRGSFTGAVKDKPGLLELADGGTFFLDEIGDVSPSIQAKFLRVLQNQEVKRVGDTRTRNVDVRIISATNKNLQDLVKSGAFREDLYYRLNVVSIEMPPLRERKSDIPLLAAHFIKKHRDNTETPVSGISEKAIKLLLEYDWPGNVRELENAIKRAAVLAEGEILQPDDFLFLELKKTEPETNRGTLAELEKKAVFEALEIYNDDKHAAAKYLGVSLRWLYYRLKEWQNESS